MRRLFTTRRALALVATTALLIGVVVQRSGGSEGSSTSNSLTAFASVGDIVVTAGGLGRIVQANAGTPVATRAAATPAGSTGSSGPGGSSGTGAPANSVFPSTSGRVSEVLVAPGDEVATGQPLVVLDDGGSTVAALGQAQNEYASAQLELDQKRTSDPAKGAPPTPAELSAAQLAVDQAQLKVAQVTGPPIPADATAAQLEVAKAKAELEVLMRPPSAAAVDAAQLALDAARRKLAQVNGPAPAADIDAARLEISKTKADLDALQQSGSASQASLDAARLAVDVANQKLARLTGPPNPTDVAAAQADVAKAAAELDALKRPPSSEASANSRLAVTLAEQKLELVMHPTSAVVSAARLDAARAAADLTVLRQRGRPASATDIAIAKLKTDLASSRVSQAQSQIERLTVRASAAGVVTALLTSVGSHAEPTAPVATVADLKELAVNVDLSEFDAAGVKRGQQAMVSVDALGGKPLAGTVLMEPLSGVDNGGVVTFPVRIGLSDSAGVKPGMGVSVRIVIAERRGVVRVPLEAVTGVGDKATVTVVKASGAMTKRAMTGGLADNKLMEVKTGLRAGEKVLLRGTSGA